MPAGKRKWTVTKADGNVVTVEASRMDEEHGVVRFYDGDDMIARYVGAQSIDPA